MDDLLAASGSAPREPKQEQSTDGTSQELDAGSDGDGGTDITTDSSPEMTADGGNVSQVAEPEDFETIKRRSQESLEDEIKKLREESAKRRLENKALKEQAADLFEEERKQMLAKQKEMEKQLKALQKIQLENEAKERGLELDAKTKELIEAKELEAEQNRKELEKLRKKHEETESKYNEYLERQREEAELKDKVLQSKIDAELEKIPEDKRTFADALVRGFEDKQAGYFELLRAKQEGLFGVKKVEVAHQVPVGDKGESTEQKQHRNNKERLSSGLSKVTGGMTPGQRLV